MNIAQLHSQFQDRGFVVVRSFLPEADFAELNRELERYIRQVVPTLPPSDAFFHDREDPATLKQLQHMGGDPYFAAYRDHPRWRTLAEGLLGETAEAQAPEWFNKPAGTDHPTPPHQDNYYFCLKPPQVVTLWLALDQVGADNGCLRYVPGSHRQGLRPHGRTTVLGFSQGIEDYGPQDREREELILLEPGDLVAHHGELIHRADANRSPRQRRAFAMVFRGASCLRDTEAYRRYEQALEQQHAKLGIENA